MLEWYGSGRGVLHRDHIIHRRELIIRGPRIAFRLLNTPGSQVDEIAPVVLVAAEVEGHLDALAFADGVEQRAALFDAFEFDILGIAVIGCRDNKLTLCESAVKCLLVHDEFNRTGKVVRWHKALLLL